MTSDDMSRSLPPFAKVKSGGASGGSLATVAICAYGIGLNVSSSGVPIDRSGSTNASPSAVPPV